MVVTLADGTEREFCVLLADTPALQSQGLMRVTTLGDYSGMVFRFGAPVTVQFFMKDTVMPLSIAFVDRQGAVVSTADMDPCPPATPSCPLFAATGPYVDALEVPRSRLGALGIGPGARVRFGGSC